MKQTEEYSIKNATSQDVAYAKTIREGSSVKFKNKSFKVNENMSCIAKKCNLCY